MGRPLSLVLFDLDDVLCDYSRPARASALAARAGCTTEHVLDAIWHSGFEHRGDAGTLDADAYLRGFGERIGYRLTSEEWVEARRAGTCARPEVLALVTRLLVRSAVLTNNPTLFADHIDRIAPELPALFPGRVFTSAGLQVAKPDPECFRRCLMRLAVPPEETLFVDDLEENVEGARRAGLVAHQYVSVADLAEALAGHGVLRPVT